MTENEINQLELNLSGHKYDILIGENAINKLGVRYRALFGSAKAFILSDSNVAPLYLQKVASELEQKQIQSVSFIVNAGEDSKSFAVLEHVLAEMSNAQLDRKSILISLGGGVVGDLGGFAASIYMRGIKFIQIPTSLLAQVDSSVGGKTAINNAYGKNLIGAFHQPSLVISDTLFLDTLLPRELLSGYAEIIKYGIIRDKAFFDWCKINAEKIYGDNKDYEIIKKAVRISCQIKASIVEQDEKEQNIRALLNFGHTFAHALELEGGYSEAILHGEAVAVGMVLAARLSARLGYCSHQEALEIESNMPISAEARIFTKKMRAETVYNNMLGDKKNDMGKINFILIKKIGDAFVSSNIDKEIVIDVLSDFIKEVG